MPPRCCSPRPYASPWEARWALAILFQFGFKPTNIDLPKAASWWDRLENEKNSEFQKAIGDRYRIDDKAAYRTGKNKWRQKLLTYQESNELAASWYEKSSRQGNIAASKRLAGMYRAGTGVQPNLQKVFVLWKEIAEAGDPVGQILTASAYYKGDGIAIDYSQALRWFKAAANNEAAARKDLALAQSALGSIYGYGYGVDVNPILGYAWANLANAGGDEDAKKLLSALEKTMTPQQVRKAQQLSSSWQPGVELEADTSVNKQPQSDKDSVRTKPKSDDQSNVSYKKVGSGSGFLISQDGLILTNHHVIDECKEIKLPYLNKVASVVLTDERNDLAVLRSDIRDLSPVTLADSDSIKQGEDIVIFGYPLDGYLPTAGNITQGLISALSGLANNSSLIQITAPVQPGNSGGPVLNMKGELAGVVVSKADAIKVAQVTGDIPQNINFAVSVRTVRGFLDGNSIEYSKSSMFTFSKNASKIADRARQYTFKLECWK